MDKDADRLALSETEIEVTPAMIEAGELVLRSRWVHLMAISEETLFSEVTAEILKAALQSQLSHSREE